ncbi:Uncharacterized protein APZ42_023503 [Daphnia magna]|uniref:Uncharacterized protein n=1 Tax=Daphnia magna TaxID=35525 RepID=A0A164UYF4_9CRUS|nr:Uncharacterized protein APZ42_023503 [Daphnia magna]
MVKKNKQKQICISKSVWFVSQSDNNPRRFWRAGPIQSVRTSRSNPQDNLGQINFFI